MKRDALIASLRVICHWTFWKSLLDLRADCEREQENWLATRDSDLKENLNIRQRAYENQLAHVLSVEAGIEEFFPDLKGLLIDPDSIGDVEPKAAATLYRDVLGQVLARDKKSRDIGKRSGKKTKSKPIKEPSKNEIEVAKLVKKHGSRAGHQLAIDKGLTKSASGARVMAYRGRKK
jgi:hypothetical protein